jgi:NADH:ubiquinone oxidoreductase subunit 5 (subunit L)/multisubunit Na+/H+ antiporter MnhA subunit
MGGVFNLLPIISILEEYWCITMLNLPNSSSYYSKELFFNTYWAYNNIYISSSIIYFSFLMCFLSFICSSLYIGYLLSWFSDKVSIKKQNLFMLYESKWLPLIILIILAIFSQLLGFILYNIFLSNNSFFTFQETSLFFFLADWNEFYLLYSSIIIILITCLIDFFEDWNNYKFNISKILFKTTTNFFKQFILIIIFTVFILFYTNNYIIWVLGLITIIYLFNLLYIHYSTNYYTIIFNLNNNQWFFFIKRITSFSLDSLFNFSLYSSLTKGLTLFYSIDNYLVETANHLQIYKRISYYLQSLTFNLFLIQININFILMIGTFIYINYYFFY